MIKYQLKYKGNVVDNYDTKSEAEFFMNRFIKLFNAKKEYFVIRVIDLEKEKIKKLERRVL